MGVKVTNGQKTVEVTTQEELRNAIAAGWTPIEGALRQDGGYAEEFDNPEALSRAAQQAGTAPEETSAELERAFSRRREINYGDTLNQIQTVGEGGLDFLTLGGYSAVQRASGNEDVGERARENPGSRTIGEAIGLVATLGASPSSLLRFTPAGVASNLGRTAASRGTLGAAVAGTAAEGALYGLGQAISDVSLQDEPIAAEAVFSQLVKGAGFGAILGGAAGGVSHGMIKLGKSLGKSATTREALIAARRDIFSETGEIATRYRSVADDVINTQRQVYDDIVQRSKATAGLNRDGLMSRAKFLDEVAEDTYIKLAMLDEVKGYGTLYNKVEKLRSKLAAADDLKAAAATIDELEKTTKKLVKLSGGNLDDLAQRIEAAGPRTIESANTAMARAAAEKLTPLIKQTEKTLKRPMGELLAKKQEAFVKELTALDSTYKELLNFSADAKLPVLVRQSFDEYFKTIDNALGVAGGKAAGISTKEFAEQIGLNALAKEIPNLHPKLEPMARLYSGLAAAGIAGVGKKNLVAQLAGTAGAGAGRGAFTGIVGIAGGAARNVGSFLGYKLGSMFAGNSGKLADFAGRVNLGVTKALNRFFTGTGKAVRSTAGPSLKTSLFSEHEDKTSDKFEQFKNRQKEIVEALGNPDATAAMIHQNLSPLRQMHIGVGDKVAVQAMRVLEYIYRNMPKDPGTIYVNGKSRWKPSRRELRLFERKYKAALSGPEDLINSILNGDGTMVEANVLKDLYGDHYIRIGFDLMAQMEDKELTRDQRNRLGTLLQIPLDSRQRVEFLQFMQQYYLGERQLSEQLQPQGGAPTGQSPLTAAQEITAR